MCYNLSTFIKQLSGLSDRLIYLLRRARTHELYSCDSEIIDPTKVNYFRLFFYFQNFFEFTVYKIKVHESYFFVKLIFIVKKTEVYWYTSVLVYQYTKILYIVYWYTKTHFSLVYQYTKEYFPH